MSEPTSDTTPAPVPATPTTSERPRSRRFAGGGVVTTVVLVLAAYAAVGALAGVVWELVWTPPGQVIVRHHVYADSYASLRGVFTGTGLYVLVGTVASALAALIVTVFVRGRELLVLVLVLVGSAIAAYLMRHLGMSLGPPDPAGIAAHTQGRARVEGNLTVAGRPPYVVWPLVSLVVLALVYFTSSGRPARGRRPAASPPADPREAGTWSSSPR